MGLFLCFFFTFYFLCFVEFVVFSCVCFVFMRCACSCGISVFLCVFMRFVFFFVFGARFYVYWYAFVCRLQYNKMFCVSMVDWLLQLGSLSRGKALSRRHAGGGAVRRRSLSAQVDRGGDFRVLCVFCDSQLFRFFVLAFRRDARQGDFVDKWDMVKDCTVIYLNNTGTWFKAKAVSPRQSPPC